MSEVHIQDESVNSKLFLGPYSSYAKLVREHVKRNDPSSEENLRDLEFILEHFDKIVKVPEEVVQKWEKEFVGTYSSDSLPILLELTESEYQEHELSKDLLFAKYFDVDITKEFAFFTDVINGVQYSFVASQN